MLLIIFKKNKEIIMNNITSQEQTPILSLIKAMKIESPIIHTWRTDEFIKPSHNAHKGISRFEYARNTSQNL